MYKDKRGIAEKSEAVGELALMVEASRERSLTIDKLIELQAGIAALRYTIGEAMNSAEDKMLSEKDRLDLYMVQGKLKLQAVDKKLPSTRALDMVMDMDECEVIRQAVIRSRIEFNGMKRAVDLSGDVLISLAGRIRRAENEMTETRMTRGHA